MGAELPRKQESIVLRVVARYRRKVDRIRKSLADTPRRVRSHERSISETQLRHESCRNGLGAHHRKRIGLMKIPISCRFNLDLQPLQWRLWLRRSESRYPMLHTSAKADTARTQGIGWHWRNWLAFRRMREASRPRVSACVAGLASPEHTIRLRVQRCPFGLTATH